MMQISSSECCVVVVNYNAGDLLLRCVRSALAAGAGEVIVVDNASVDQSIARLRQADLPASVRIIENGGNLGFAAACNNGTRATQAETLLYLNPDSAIEPDGIAILLAELYSDEQIGMVGGLLLNPDGTEQRGGRRNLPSPKRAFMQAFGLSRLAGIFPQAFADSSLHRQALPEQPIDVEAISGACMMVKREALTQVGLWDEGYFLHCEDLDWCARFNLAGRCIRFVPAARIVHEWGACSQSRPYFVEWHKHKGMLRFYRKFYRAQYPALMWWPVVLGVWMRFSLVCVAKTPALLHRSFTRMA